MYSGMKWECVMRERALWQRRIDRADSVVFIPHSRADALLVAANSAINQALSMLYLQLITSKMTNK